jgi:hypothetical protein
MYEDDWPPDSQDGPKETFLDICSADSNLSEDPFPEDLWEIDTRLDPFHGNNRRRAYSQGLMWLGHALWLPTSFDLSGLITRIKEEGSDWCYRPPIWATDGSRVILEPIPELKRIQRRVNRLLERQFRTPKDVFGFSGGSCLDVAQRHRQGGSTMCFDLRHAFFTVSRDMVYKALQSEKKQYGFSKTVAEMISLLCTYSPATLDLKAKFWCGNTFLPQGAPSSPRLFDISLHRLDRKLRRLATRVNGRVSRFADNYYFSVPADEFSPRLQKAIICEVHIKGFYAHKVRVANRGEMCRILGYNVADTAITTTRDFRRKLRGQLYMLESLIDRCDAYEDALCRVNGMMAWAQNLPQPLLDAHARCLHKILNP